MPRTAQDPYVDPRVIRSRALIIEAATARFLRHGFAGTSVDDIAADAGLAKRTVFNVFGDKEALFRATVLEAIEIAERFAEQLRTDIAAPGPVAGRLHELGRALARSVLAGPVIPLRRLLVSEAARFPELALEYRRRAPELVMHAIAGLLAELAAAGELRVDDPDTAAEHFAFLVMGADLDRGMFLAAPEPPSPARIDARADAGVQAFLRAYAA